MVDKSAIEEMVAEGLIENEQQLADMNEGIPSNFGVRGGGDTAASDEGMANAAKTDGKPTPLKK